MIKTFKRIARTNFGTILKSFDEVETNGDVVDWYTNLVSETKAWLVGYEHMSYDRIVDITVWDCDETLYNAVTDRQLTEEYLSMHGMYIKYVKDSDHPDGDWFGQYPCNAWNLDGVFDPIDTVCSNLNRDPNYHRVVDREYQDVMTAVLFPDHVVSVGQDVNAMIVPRKSQVLDTIDDAIKAFEMLKSHNCGSCNIMSAEHSKCTNDIIERLMQARLWVDSCTLRTKYV